MHARAEVVGDMYAKITCMSKFYYSIFTAPMETLEPQPAPGQRQTLVSWLFPHSERAVARRAKYLEEPEPPKESPNTLAEKDPETFPAEEPGKLHATTTDIDDVYNGPQISVHEERDVRAPRTLGSFGAFFNIVAFSVALAVLSIPKVVAVVGIVPFILMNAAFALLTYLTAREYWKLAMMYPGVHSLEHAGDIIYGPVAAKSLSFIQLIFCIFLQGNHALLGGYAFYSLGWHDCMVGLVAVFSVVSFVFTLPRSYRLFSVLAIISFTSIIVVIIIVMISAGVGGPINKSPSRPPVETHAFGAARGIPHTFIGAMPSVSALFSCYAAYPTYLPVLAEMRSPRTFNFSLIAVACTTFTLYVIVGCVVNNYLGQYAKSPSLASLTPIMIKVSYGLALPTIMIAGCASGQVSGKALYIITFRGRRRHWANKPYVSWTAWIVINIVTWALGFVLAEVIPFFDSFLGLESALFVSLFFGITGIIYLWRHQFDYRANWRNALGTFAAVSIIVIGLFLMIAGIWGAAALIENQYANGEVGSPFSCAMPDL